MNRVHIAGMTFVALLFLPWVSASASTIYNTTESYTENYIGVDLGGGVYSYLYAGHDVTSSGYSSPPATYTETYIYTPDGESDIGTQVTPAGLIYYAATDTKTDIINPLPGGRGQTFMPAERMTAGEKEWTASNTMFEGGMGIDATVPFGYENDFMRPVYPVDRVDLKKWFSDKDIQNAKSRMHGWVLSLARTGR